jgi:hypothetical protein
MTKSSQSTKQNIPMMTASVQHREVVVTSRQIMIVHCQMFHCVTKKMIH